jgi:hypothetical protein
MVAAALAATIRKTKGAERERAYALDLAHPGSHRPAQIPPAGKPGLEAPCRAAAADRRCGLIGRARYDAPVRLLCLLLLVAGCGRIGFEPEADATVSSVCPSPFVRGPFSTEFDETPPWSDLSTTSPATMMVISGSQLVVDLAIDAGGEYAVFDSGGPSHDARNRLLRTHAVELPDRVLGTEALLAWYQDESNKAAIGLVNGMLIAQVTSSGLRSGWAEPFPAQLEPWWQLVSNGLNLEMQVSDDGLAWRTLHTEAVPPFFSTVDPTVGVGTNQPVADPGQARFDLLLDCIEP